MDVKPSKTKTASKTGKHFVDELKPKGVNVPTWRLPTSDAQSILLATETDSSPKLAVLSNQRSWQCPGCQATLLTQRIKCLQHVCSITKVTVHIFWRTVWKFVKPYLVARQLCLIVQLNRWLTTLVFSSTRITKHVRLFDNHRMTSHRLTWRGWTRAAERGVQPNYCCWWWWW